MRRTNEVCVGAGLAIKIVVTEPDSGRALELFEGWTARGVRLIAPAFFEAEVDTILRKKSALKQELTTEEADAAFAALKKLPARRVILGAQRQRAWEISRAFAFPTVYDAIYLALAELRGCQF
jgi:predicted nucleic acid-binding protein